MAWSLERRRTTCTLSDGLGGDGGGGGEFSFALKGVRAVPITRTPPADLKQTAEDAGAGVKATMDDLFFFGYVDEDSWGDYGDAFALFDEEAADQAEEDTDVLTLGADASERYASVEPGTSTIRIAVLTDRRDRPVSAVAIISFRGTAELQDGSSTTIASSGSFFLRRAGQEWRITAYRVDRDEEPASDGGSASPTEEAA
jgi:hypothetical protein